jgi:alpha/beta superfamily hydrolase
MAHHRSPVREALTLQGPAGALEALLEEPRDGGHAFAGVICHPHPLHQGTMRNKVVHTVARAMNDLQIPALRFNFRGVGASEGRYGEGIGETEDAVAACLWLRTRYPGAGIWLAGFSFGGVVACRSALTVHPAQLITIAPPPERARTLLDGSQPGGPWLVIQGDADDVVSSDEVQTWVRSLNPAPEFVLLPGVDHFFHGHINLLRETLVARLAIASGRA